LPRPPGGGTWHTEGDQPSAGRGPAMVAHPARSVVMT